MDKKIVPFARQKDYVWIEDVGFGATGDIKLLKDEEIDELFVCKKYSLSALTPDVDYYDYFKSEIKLLHLLFHRNVVRVFYYYLYPEQHTGYIFMEYVKGERIDRYIANNPDKIEIIFEQVIDAFVHIHEAGILHRDIKPSNILVTQEGIAKVIDFGFGKQVQTEQLEDENSLSLVLLYDKPNDYKEYNYITEVYFVGVLFNQLIDEHQIETFKYKAIVEKMATKNPVNRIKSFRDVQRLMTDIKNDSNHFDSTQLLIYQNFANGLSDILSGINVSTQYITDIDKITENLEDSYKRCMLESFVQNNSSIITIFLSGGYRFYRKKLFPVSHLKLFIDFLKSIPIEQKKIVLNNLWNRLDAKPRLTEEDLPF